jgi:hypothetical protein
MAEDGSWQLTHTKHHIAHTAECFAPANMRAAGEPRCCHHLVPPPAAVLPAPKPGRRGQRTRYLQQRWPLVAAAAAPLRPLPRPRPARAALHPLAYPPRPCNCACPPAGENPHYQELLQSWINGGYKLRYSGGMVPDVHHIVAKVRCAAVPVPRHAASGAPSLARPRWRPHAPPPRAAGRRAVLQPGQRVGARQAAARVRVRAAGAGGGGGGRRLLGRQRLHPRAGALPRRLPPPGRLAVALVPGSGQPVPCRSDGPMAGRGGGDMPGCTMC